MRKVLLVWMLIFVVGLAVDARSGFAKSSKSSKSGKSMKSMKEKCTYELSGSLLDSTATVEIDKEKLTIEVKGAVPDTLYTVWVDFRNRAELASSGSTEEAMADDYPIPFNVGVDLSYSGPGVARGVAPAFATTDPVFSGMGMDKNGFVTNDQGDATFQIQLDYRLLESGDSPVVAEDLVHQGGAENRVGGGWLRLYTAAVNTAASVQQVDGVGLPIVVRATAQGITIVGHFDMVTHGHTPGVGGVDHFSGFKGDFDCP